MAYTDIDKPSDYFNTVLYTGNASTQSITGVGFSPDFIWGKNRSSVTHHALVDTVRGNTKYVKSSTNAAEATITNMVTAFGSDGFSLGADSDMNGSSANQVAWNWKAGTSFTNDASATGIGSIDSTGSVNTDAGFSIISYTGNGSAGATIGHGLGVTPKMFIVKSRSLAQDFTVYNEYIGNTNGLFLNNTDASTGDSSYFNNTSPTSSVFTVGTNARGNTNGATYIAYCFNDVQGYSKFGSYTGNGNADGPFCFTGFKPAFVLTKTASAAYHWSINDNKRNTFNPNDKRLYPSTNGVEATADAYDIDFLSNGFKIRSSSVSFNASGDNVIYMAFAENPFVTGASAIPTTAR